MNNNNNQTNWGEVRPRVEMINYTKDPVSIVVAALKTKKSTKPVEINKKLSQSDLTTLENALSYMDTSALEHINFTFQVSGISVTAKSQLSNSMQFIEEQSRESVSATRLGFVIPDSIRNNSVLLNMYLDSMQGLYDTYDELVSCGISKADAQYVMPLSLTTSMLATCTGRKLFESIIPLCTCKKVHWEVREVAVQIHHILLFLAPVIFKMTGPRCHFGRCKDIEECKKEVEKINGKES